MKTRREPREATPLSPLNPNPSHPRPLRIVHASPFYWPSIAGGESQVKAISDRLAARGHKVMVITQKRVGVTGAADPSLAAQETVNGVDVRRLYLGRRPEALLNAVLRLPGSWWLLRRLFSDLQIRGLAEGPFLPHAWGIARRFHPDVITCSNYYFSGLAYTFLRAPHKRFCPVVGIPLLHLEERWSQTPIALDLIRRSAALLVNTDHERRFLKSIGYPDASIHTLGGGVEPSDFAHRDGARIRAEHGLGTAPVVGYIGRMAASKGVVTLLHAMRTVWRSHPSARLMLAGHRFRPGSHSDVPVEQALAELTQAERQRVVHVGPFAPADKASLFAAIDVFAMPSVAESFGIAFLEAWICEKPVVGARIGAVECVVSDGVDGFLAPPNDAEATGAAISKLLASPGLRSRFAAAGRVKTEARFTWERATDEVERLYGELASGASRQAIEQDRAN